jgi:SAM-dependent methyltransferase
VASTGAASYTGTDNLEVMKEAELYNRYLTRLITTQLKSGDTVLDFGAGLGTFAYPLRARGIDPICVEPDAALRNGLDREGFRTHAGLADIANASVDFIYTLNVLEHIADDHGAVRELARKLAPGGRILVYVPAFPVLFSSMDRKVGHLRRYRRRQLEQRLVEAGLRVSRSQYVDSLGFVATLVYRTVGRGAGDINRSALRIYDRFVFPISLGLDTLVSRWLGKNLLVIGAKP